MNLPFDGAISAFYENQATPEMRRAIAGAKSGEIIDPGYPYKKRMKRDQYEAELYALQIELVKMQIWCKETAQRIAIVFEGRDAAGKGGTIKRFVMNLNPRGAAVVALAKPSEVEKSEWYFQRYLDHMPSAGQVTCFDRSWYNRGVVEKVFGFCRDTDRERFFHQVPDVERMYVEDGVRLFKIWLSVGRREQLRRFLKRESDPLKQWKLSPIDVEGLAKWDDYTAAIAETMDRSNLEFSPWHVVRSDDKRRARLNALRVVLTQLDYTYKDPKAVGSIDPNICGGPELLDV